MSLTKEALTKAKDYCGAMSTTMSVPLFLKLSTNESGEMGLEWHHDASTFMWKMEIIIISST